MTNQSVDKKDWAGRMGSLAARPNLFYSASPELTRKGPETTLGTTEGKSTLLPVCLRLTSMPTTAMLFVYYSNAMSPCFIE
jgi:hypothetical protein